MEREREKEKRKRKARDSSTDIYIWCTLFIHIHMPSHNYPCYVTTIIYSLSVLVILSLYRIHMRLNDKLSLRKPSCFYCKNPDVQCLSPIQIHDVCIYCNGATQYCICTDCRTKHSATVFPCVMCHSIVSLHRDIPLTDFFRLEHPDSMKDKCCSSCKQYQNVRFRLIRYFCSDCYSNHDSRYVCDFCFHEYTVKCKVCFVCCTEIVHA